ncbi:MAG: histidine--tRNA ligase [Pseudomonadota bacterium]
MVQGVRGMRDLLPVQTPRWRAVETAAINLLSGYAYQEVQLPLLEYTALFARGVGEATDIVEKEMYSMSDRDGDSLSLRPEGTASCVRVLNENGLLYNQTQKVFYTGPMFRYEKPQRGRYRQFYQVGAEVFGFAGPDVDAELVAVCAELWQYLGVADHVRLEINTLGDQGARRAYREALVEFLTPLAQRLDEDSQRRLQTNPLRILDSKDENTQALLVGAPELADFVDEQARAHFDGLCATLDALGIEYVHNPRLVRGLDYYTHTVFEWITDQLGAQGTICGGGRYDGLVERLGGKATPAAGFAIGTDRVDLLVEAVHQAAPEAAADVYICMAGAVDTSQALVAAARLRTALPGRKVRSHMGGGALKKQLKRADAGQARVAVILGETELAAGEWTIKHLADGEQQTLAVAAALEQIRTYF